MSLYSIALFLHIAGALGFFAALGLEWATVMQLKRVTTAEQVRDWLGASGSMRRVGMISMLVLLAAGIYMMVTVWHGVAWLIVSFVVIALMMVVMGRVSGPRMKAVHQTLANEKGMLTHVQQEAVRHPMLWAGLQMRVVLGLGIVFLMTVKPDLVGSLVTMAVTVVIGLISAWPTLNRNQRTVQNTIGDAS